jgi:CRP-like cAMP-binding protein
VRLGGNKKVDLIAKVPLFEQCSKRELEEVASIADEIDLDEGKALMREGDPGREFFGEIALISQGPRTATVTTTSPVRALVVTERSFKRLVEKSPEIERKVLAAAVDRLNPKFRREVQR